MDYRIIKTAADKIRMSEEMKQRIIRNCKIKQSNQMEEKTMKHHNRVRKPAVVVAVLAVCLTLSVTVLAAPGILQGYFRDITNWQGAIVGLSYEQATDEIGMEVTVNGNELTALVTFFNPQDLPYRETEKLGIAAYRIVDANGNVVKEGAAESTEVVNGQATISIKLDDIDSGSCKLIVTAFVSEKKADQPLNLNGRWECNFTK